GLDWLRRTRFGRGVDHPDAPRHGAFHAPLRSSFAWLGAHEKPRRFRDGTIIKCPGWTGFAGPGLAVEWIPRTLRAMGLSMRPFAQASLGLVRMKSPAAFATARSSRAQVGLASPDQVWPWSGSPGRSAPWGFPCAPSLTLRLAWCA